MAGGADTAAARLQTGGGCACSDELLDGRTTPRHGLDRRRRSGAADVADEEGPPTGLDHRRRGLLPGGALSEHAQVHGEPTKGPLDPHDPGQVAINCTGGDWYFGTNRSRFRSARARTSRQGLATQRQLPHFLDEHADVGVGLRIAKL